MSEQRIKIPRALDRSVVDVFKEVAGPHNVSSAHISALGFSSLGQVNISSEAREDLAALLELKSTLIDSMSMQLNGLGIAYYRGGKYPVEQKSPVYDEIVLSHHPQHGDLPNIEKLKIVAMLNKKLKAFDPKRLAGAGVSDEQNQMIAIHESTLERLELLNEELISKGNEFRQQLEEETRKKIAAYEVNFEDRRAKLESDYQAQVFELQSAKEALDKRLKEVDDRDNTHVRRELRKALQDEIKNRQDTFHLTKDTTNLRWPIHITCITAICVLIQQSYMYGDELIRSISAKADIPITVLTMASIKTASLTISAIGFLIFYLRWMNRWLEQHTQTEFQLKQFQLDVDRASWVVETSLAWKNEVKDVIPTVLLESIAKNLFQFENKTKEAPLHPGDQLASAILGTASKVRVKAGDTELEFNGKDLKKKMSEEK